MTPSDSLSIIKRIAVKAAGIIEGKRSNFSVGTKSSEYDIVTSADVASEKFVVSELRKAFPQDEILAEENNHAIDLNAYRIWMVDPLDGTKDFSLGGTAYCVMIDLCENGVPVLGVIYIPKRDTLYFAEKGKGAFVIRNGVQKQLHVSNISSLEESRLTITKPSTQIRKWDPIPKRMPVKERFVDTSAGAKIGHVAEGNAEMWINTNPVSSKWDTCGPQIILEEAGGKITDFDGKPLDYRKSGTAWTNSYVATNGILHEKVIRIINEKETKE